MYKNLCDFFIRTDHSVHFKRPDLDLINEKRRICRLSDFAVKAADQKVKEKEGILIPGVCQRAKKAMDRGNNSDTSSYFGDLGMVSKTWKNMRRTGKKN